MKLFKNQKGFSDVITMTILSGVIGAIFIGGVFVWKEIDKSNSINNLYSKLSRIVKVEKEVDELREEGWLTYTNKILGFSFDYPERYGEVEISFSNYGDDLSAAASGKLFRGTFSSETDIVFGGTSLDFQAGRGGAITDSQGYIFDGDQYYSRMPGSKKRLINPILTLDNNGNIILVINDDSFNDGSGISGWGLVPNTRAALVNFENKNEYAGMAIYNKNTNNISDNEFNILLSTFKFLD